MKSILQFNKECYFCKSIVNLHCHHIYSGTANRKVSENNGFKVWLCNYHHNGSNNSVHFNKEMNLKLKKDCQKEFEKYHDRNEFLKLIGKSYL